MRNYKLRTDLKRAVIGTFALPLGIEPLDALIEELQGRRWEQDWAAMVRDKAAKTTWTLSDAINRFDRFIRPILAAMGSHGAPGAWPRGGPWAPPRPERR